MQIIRSAVTEQGGKRFVECDFADAVTLQDATQYIQFRVEINSEGHPRVPECLLEALRAARTPIGSEVQRLSALLPFDP